MNDEDIAHEAKRWQGLMNIFDDKWFVLPSGGLETQRQRLIRRHLYNWDDRQTKAWKAQTPAEGAEQKVRISDMPNVSFVKLNILLIILSGAPRRPNKAIRRLDRRHSLTFITKCSLIYYY